MNSHRRKYQIKFEAHIAGTIFSRWYINYGIIYRTLTYYNIWQCTRKTLSIE